MSKFSRALGALTFTALLGASPAWATTVPFTESFSTGDSGWQDITGGITSLTHVPGGGADGGGYVSTTFNFVDSEFGAQGPVLFRGSPAASSGAFAGDWLADDVGTLTLSVRHDAGVPINFFARFASPFNFPGGIAVQFVPVIPIPGPAGWTEQVFVIDPANPMFVSFEGSDFASVFSNIGHLQIGVSIPEALAGVDRDISFDLDVVTLAAPEPGALALLGLGLAALALRVRRRA